MCDPVLYNIGIISLCVVIIGTGAILVHLWARWELRQVNRRCEIDSINTQLHNLSLRITDLEFPRKKKGKK